MSRFETQHWYAAFDATVNHCPPNWSQLSHACIFPFINGMSFDCPVMRLLFSLQKLSCREGQSFIGKLIQANVRKHFTMTTFEQLWPELRENLVLSSLARMQDLEAYENQVLSDLVDGKMP